MDPQYFLLSPESHLPASLSSKLLGSIVPNYADPLAELQPSDVSTFLARDTILLHTINDFEVQALSSKTNSLSGGIQGVAGLETSIEDISGMKIEGEKMVCVRLRQHAAHLDNLMQDTTVKERVMVWTKRALFRPPPVCMIVGIMLCEGSTVYQVNRARNNVGANGLLPIASVGMAAMAGGLPISMPFGDIEFGVHFSNEQSMRRTGKIDHMVIVGLQLRIVRRRTWAKEVRLSRKAVSLPSGRHLAGEEDDLSDSEDEENEANEEWRNLEDAEQELGDSPWRLDPAASERIVSPD